MTKIAFEKEFPLEDVYYSKMIMRVKDDKREPGKVYPAYYLLQNGNTFDLAPFFEKEVNGQRTLTSMAVTRVVVDANGNLLRLSGNKVTPIIFEDRYEKAVSSISNEIRKMELLSTSKKYRTITAGNGVVIEYDADSEDLGYDFDGSAGKPSHFWVSVNGLLYDVNIVLEEDTDLMSEQELKNVLEIKEMNQYRLTEREIQDKDLALMIAQAVISIFEELTEECTEDAYVLCTYEGHAATASDPAELPEYEWSCWHCDSPISGEPGDICRCATCLRPNYMDYPEKDYER